MKTKENIVYREIPFGFIVTIPKGTSVIPATNLPYKDKFWVKSWLEMDQKALDWFNNYGFLVSNNDVEA